MKKTVITATAIQNSISIGVIGVSILLPLTVGILGFTLKQEKVEPVVNLFCACVFVTISLTAALWNMFRLPSIVNVYNVANDWQTSCLMTIQLFYFLWGAIYLLFGALEIIKLKNLNH